VSGSDGGAGPGGPDAGAKRASGSGRRPRRVLDLLEGLKAGSVRPGGLGVAERTACADYLWGEGVSAQEAARLLGVSERTIFRCRRRALRERALGASPRLAAELAGELIHEARQSAQRLRRLGRDRDADAAARIAAECAVLDVFDKALRRAQAMGCLGDPGRAGAAPRAPGDEAELDRLAETARAVGGGSAALERSLARPGPAQPPLAPQPYGDGV